MVKIPDRLPGRLSEPTSLDMLLAQVCRLHYARAHFLLERVALHRGQPPLLYALWAQDGLTHGELAARLHVQPATITRMVQRMRRAGFVSRMDDPTDDRVSRVMLTEKGRAIRAEVELVWQTLEAEALAGVGSDDRERLWTLLTHVRENLIEVTR